MGSKHAYDSMSSLSALKSVGNDASTEQEREPTFQYISTLCVFLAMPTQCCIRHGPSKWVGLVCRMSQRSLLNKISGICDINRDRISRYWFVAHRCACPDKERFWVPMLLNQIAEAILLHI